jgi:gluconate kinase
LLHAPFPELVERLARRAVERQELFVPEWLAAQVRALEWPHFEENLMVLDGRLPPEQTIDTIRLNLACRPADLDPVADACPEWLRG